MHFAHRKYLFSCNSQNERWIFSAKHFNDWFVYWGRSNLAARKEMNIHIIRISGFKGLRYLTYCRWSANWIQLKKLSKCNVCYKYLQLLPSESRMDINYMCKLKQNLPLFFTVELVTMNDLLTCVWGCFAGIWAVSVIMPELQIAKIKT